MASQRVLLIAVAGKLAENMWDDLVRWSDARTSHDTAEWSPDDWSQEIQGHVKRFSDNIQKSAYTPPVLYRTEHVDLWSMGDVFHTVLSEDNQDVSRRLYTNDHELIATWIRDSNKRTPAADATQETLWLHQRVSEAINAWGEIAEDRLLVLVRTVLGGLWSDDDIATALRHFPEWYLDS